MEIPNCSKGKIDHCTSTNPFHLFFFLPVFTFYMYNLACMRVTKSLHNLYILKCFYFFSDLLTIDEKLFSTNCPPLDALPLYLSHFQFIETSSEDKVKLSFGLFGQHFSLVFVA